MTRILSASEGSRYLPIMTQKLVNTSRREAGIPLTVPLSHCPTFSLIHQPPFLSASYPL